RHVRTGALGVAALLDLISAPNRIFHARDAAAQVLLERTGGRCDLVVAEAEDWCRRGIALWTGRLEVEPARLDRLRALRSTPSPRSRRASDDTAGSEQWSP